MMSSESLYRHFGKRLIDICFSAGVLLVAAPLMVAIWLSVRVFLGAPALFRQVRPGRHERLFTIYKFRTMRDGKDARGNELPDSERLTPFGAFLRRTSLDELPEFWNVLKGDMSVVGPRPLLVKYLPFFTEAERARFLVRPGITGWAQVNGRNEALWDDRLGRDIWYVENLSLLLDVKIIWLTVLKTIRCRDIVVDARSIMLNLDEERAQKASRNELGWKT
jgi:undecaprenyl phosphate N,N'-diacetylbacillosamine 1-phosphate transferase